MLASIIVGRVVIVDYIRREVKVDVGLESKDDCGGYGRDLIVIDRVESGCLSAAGALIGRVATFKIMKPKNAISREVSCEPFVEDSK